MINHKLLKMIKRFNIYIIVLLGVLLYTSCKDDDNSFLQLDKERRPMMTTECKSDSSLTLISQVLEKAGRADLMNTYGSYALFAPNDNAFEAWLIENKKSSIEDCSKEELIKLLDYHTLMRARDLTALRTGTLSDTTISGDRLFLELNRGLNDMRINKTAKLLRTSEVGNGRLHVLSEVLTPPAGNIYDYLKESGKFNILCQAFEEAGLVDTLRMQEFHHPMSDDEYSKWNVSYTVLAETDEVYTNDGYANYDALKAAILERNAGALSEAKAIEAFARYHIISDLRYVFQMHREESYRTLALNRTQIIHVDSSDIVIPQPLLNATKDESGSLVGGVRIEYDKSDRVLQNGVVHQLDGVLFIPTSFDRPIPIYRECENGLRYYNTTLGIAEDFDGIRYSAGRVSTTIAEGYSTKFADDYGVALGYYPEETADWVEFVIPNVVPGEYQVLLSYKRDKGNASREVNVYFRNDKEPFNWRTQLIKKKLDLGDPDDKVNDPVFGQDRLLSTVTIDTYGDYTIRFAHADKRYAVYDLIKLIPVATADEEEETDEN
ncbi:hypothetical protein EMN47_03020 [Prolixibacteraceae bacterium JC049]|nr:hypothetical protein [Prolixibacteraceae bacterium JC049]